MRLERALVVAQREYLTRVKSVGFWLATLVLPLFIAAMGIVSSLLVLKSVSAHRVGVIDETGVVGPALVEQVEGEQARRAAREDRPAAGLEEQIERQLDPTPFLITLEEPAADPAAQQAELDRRVLDDELDAWVRITAETLDDGKVEYHAVSVSNVITQEMLEDEISAAVRAERFRAAGFDPERAAELGRSVRLATFKVTEEGGEEEGAEAGLILAYALFFMLYFVLVFYGQQVMNGVIEEKSSRIVEVIVSTVQPFELLMGKLLGICGAALTQLGVWLATIVIVTVPGIVSTMAWIPEEVDVPTISVGLVVHFVLLFLLGFFVFTAAYAAVGSAFNNLQEAQQWAGVVVAFLIAPMLFFWMVINDPDSTISVVTSLIPTFTPLIMMLRIALKTPPAWQIALGYLLTTGFTVGMIWLAARVYRTGILMYGKKPTIKELWRWVRYA